MSQPSVEKIAIIGGGFCGIMTVVNLLRKAKKPLSIFLFNSTYPDGKGIAYSTYSDKHILNVPCQNMSAFPEEPDHFLKWCSVQPGNSLAESVLAKKFLSRNLYGKYLTEIFDTELRNKPHFIHFELINEEVHELTKIENKYSITSESGNSILADKVVLATGNHPPAHPSISNTDFLNSQHYFANPWQENAVINIEPNETILIIGTGLTMVDVVLGLTEKEFKGQIISLSPNGFTILAHKIHHPQRNILDELEPPFDLTKLFKLFYKHIRQARLRGESGETVVDAVRSHTQEIWQQLSLEDKKRFMNHLRHLWGVARHRLPGEIHEQIQDLISNKKLQILAGRIIDISDSIKGAIVEVKLRGTNQLHTLKVQRIINCTGPLTDISKFNSSLYSQMLSAKLVRADEMKLGIDASADGRIIEHDGKINKTLFTLGSLLKGKLWESTAVPELRKQAVLIAELLLSEEL